MNKEECNYFLNHKGIQVVYNIQKNIYETMCLNCGTTPTDNPELWEIGLYKMYKERKENGEWNK